MALKSFLIICGQMHFVMAAFTLFCPCQIQKQGVVNCSSLSLASVPDCVPNSTWTLYLNDNKLYSIKSNEFVRFLYLGKLYLERNNLTKIETGAFEGLTKLEHLSLASNDLKYSDSYPTGVFKPLKLLRTLDLSGNCNSRVVMNCSYPEETLMSATNLEFLKIDGLNSVPLGKGFAALKRLRHLRMSQDNVMQSYCYLPKLTIKYFLSLTYTPVAILELHGCDSQNVEQNIFASLRNLTTLKITGNPKLCTIGLFEILSGLSATRIRSLAFSEWCQNRNAYMAIRKELSYLLRNTSLESLQLTSMSISYIVQSFADNLPHSIVELSFRDNSLMSISFCLELYKLPNLRKLDISAQSKHIYITGSRQQEHGSDISGGQVSQLPDKETKPAFPVKYVNLTGGLIFIKILNMSFNNIEISQNGFTGLTNMEELYLQGNNFGKNIMTHENIFFGLRQLKILNLSENVIQNLPDRVFETLKSLQYLYLSKNSLRNIRVSFIKLAHLRYIDLSYNELQTISNENMQHFSTLSSLKFSFQGNHLPCSCSNHDLISWLSKHPQYINSQLKCKYKNDTVINVQDTDEILEKLLFECNLLFSLCIAASILIFLSVITIVVVLFFHKRWKLRYLCSVSRKTLNPYHPILGNNITLDIDIYISYDMDFLVEPNYCLHKIMTTYIVPELTRSGRVVIIREDIIPGRPVTSEIADVIRRSKKIVIFISSGYTFDFINTFEFDTSVIEGVFTRRDAIIAVAVGDVDNMDLKPEVMAILLGKVQENDVIYFPNNFIRNKELFLQQLEAKLNV